MDVLAKGWLPCYQMPTVMVFLLSLLSDPVVNEPLDSEIGVTNVQDRQLYD